MPAGAGARPAVPGDDAHPRRLRAAPADGQPLSQPARPAARRGLPQAPDPVVDVAVHRRPGGRELITGGEATAPGHPGQTDVQWRGSTPRRGRSPT